MAFRDLVTGGGACVVPGADGASSSANPLAGFADSLLGSASKTQEKLRELPGLAGPGQSSTEFVKSQSLTSLPGSEVSNGIDHRANAEGSQFYQSFHDLNRGGYGDAWGEAVEEGLRPPLPAIHRDREELAQFSQFEQIFGQEAALPPQRVLSGFLRSFLDSSRAEAPFHAIRLPELGLSEADKRRIRDRSSIMARHFFADKSDEFVNAQVTALLQSLDIENELRFRGPIGGRFSELEGYWNEAQRPDFKPREISEFDGPADQWADTFTEEYGRYSNPGNWASEFQANHANDSWVQQFGEHQNQMVARAQFRNGEVGSIAAMEQTRSLVNTLSQNQDPKFQNSKFLQFVSKMSRGELIVEDNQVKPVEGWANEFHRDFGLNGQSWAEEFTAQKLVSEGSPWASEFIHSHPQVPSTSDEWVNDFSQLHVNDWADEFGEQVAQKAFGQDSNDNWLDSYDKFVEEQLKGEHLPSSSKWAYQFADQNPYVGHPNPLKEGQDLFRRGLLSEAVLALEAEVLKNPGNAEGWHLLGITHAENDDDRQAIASMVQARDADPTNLEVLLALGVGHTNELEQAEALRYLRGWLQHHPKYGKLVGESTQLNHAAVTALVNEAAVMAPEDGDVHTVLGVLYNLSREYDKAIISFQIALKLKPRDYSLWNKLGATQANSARSADAIFAYQQALDLKPNYVRAWSNMGIGYANQGRYEESIRYYVRALSMNPKAYNVWDYLRISLAFVDNQTHLKSSGGAQRSDLLEVCDKRDLDTLQKQFPM